VLLWKRATWSRPQGGRFASDGLTACGFAFLLRSCAVEWQRVLRPGGRALGFIDRPGVRATSLSMSENGAGQSRL